MFQILGDLDAAIGDFTEAIRLKRQYIDAYDNRAYTLAIKNDNMGAIADYEKYLELNGAISIDDKIEVENRIYELKKGLTKK